LLLDLFFLERLGGHRPDLSTLQAQTPEKVAYLGRTPMKPRQRFNLILSFGNAAGRMVAKKCFQLQPMLIQFALRMVETYGLRLSQYFNSPIELDVLF